ncbi:hemolysin III, putative [Plasmodium yoelii]|uniref:Hemolysin III n=2 Tax=Plasmodium yoelii TaxID=5861 RepID=A0AAE9WWT6_PLAYO|nr:hemolysin III, putative [Plasmodium yoelii]WBY59904.1 hemolysin III [Plasmodium yoelii yoelii]CDU19849.1 hemolysin, putative [Plasmodium yoelii]VTZ80606.1 hemolysin III, putative [Plasmodium yoelii]|eukprot:XP_022813563.1 hemolysin III, putative [Plasmodium yoelii]
MMGYHGRLVNYFKNCCNINIFNVNDNSHLKVEEQISRMIKDPNLIPNDKKIIGLYCEKKITKSMLIKYLERHDKPLLRGKIHLMILLFSPIWIFYMLHLSKTYSAKMFTSVALICILFNSFASFLLHSFEWSPKNYFLIEKLDHIGIFLMISGSAFPVAALLLNNIKLLYYIIIHSLSSLLGILCICCSYFSTGNRAKRAFTYVMAGLLHAIFFNDYIILLYARELAFLIMIGVLYVLGAVIYSLKKPNIINGVFGFHELFHACCLGSVLFTFALNRSVLMRKS